MYGEELKPIIAISVQEMVLSEGYLENKLIKSTAIKGGTIIKDTLNYSQSDPVGNYCLSFYQKTKKGKSTLCRLESPLLLNHHQDIRYGCYYPRTLRDNCEHQIFSIISTSMRDNG